MRRSQDAPLYELAMRGRLDLRAAWHVARIIRREGYEIVHAHTPRSALIARTAAALTGVPLVCHVHSPASRDSTRRLQNRVNALAERFSLRGAGRVIGVSESLGRHLERSGLRAERIRVVPNGVPAAGPLPARERPAGTWTLGTVALFRPRKGIEVLLDALARLHARGLPVRLRAVGPFETPEYQRKIRGQASRLGIDGLIEWTGLREDVNAELAAMDLFVLPSLFGEGLPMVVLEAMASGVPVVATRVEGVPEAIRDGLDGLLCEPGDAEDLARAIESVVCGDLDWGGLRASALDRHAEKFSDRAMAAAVAGVYRELLGE
jgi:glycosyltransferase involved in cell wall biosynthesis